MNFISNYFNNHLNNNFCNHLTKYLSTFVLVLTLGACGGGGGEVETNPPAQQDPQSTEYTGPAPTTEDIQKYKTFLWDNISTEDKCGACHTEKTQNKRQGSVSSAEIDG